MVTLPDEHHDVSMKRMESFNALSTLKGDLMTSIMGKEKVRKENRFLKEQVAQLSSFTLPLQSEVLKVTAKNKGMKDSSKFLRTNAEVGVRRELHEEKERSREIRERLSKAEVDLDKVNKRCQVSKPIFNLFSPTLRATMRLKYGNTPKKYSKKKRWTPCPNGVVEIRHKEEKDKGRKLIQRESIQSNKTWRQNDEGNRRKDNKCNHEESLKGSTRNLDEEEARVTELERNPKPSFNTMEQFYIVDTQMSIEHVDEPGRPEEQTLHQNLVKAEYKTDNDNDVLITKFVGKKVTGPHTLEDRREAEKELNKAMVASKRRDGSKAKIIKSALVSHIESIEKSASKADKKREK
ncbi:uncharacterized protein LOC132619839 [Lycium barbarum]|uniref:uncharacterized protein LOC132619839 n=1 Tax=Lycium barbarum TaxID=112863 RepID=UPI00293E69A3|nr:uncharacterized protein LOC132619839 [Lycium barbarum]